MLCKTTPTTTTKVDKYRLCTNELKCVTLYSYNYMNDVHYITTIMLE